MTTELILGICFGGGLGCTYFATGNAFTHALECRTKVRLTKSRFALISTIWPLFVLAWHFAPKETRAASPFSLSFPTSERERDQLRSEASWQSRWDFFTEQVEEARREGNPVARERAEEHLRFLEETRPPELKKLKVASKPKKAPLPDDFKQQVERAVLLVHKIPPHRVTPQSKVGFCNICASYRDAKFSMEGVCFECYDEQGF